MANNELQKDGMIEAAPRTVRVRIAVVIDEHGDYAVAGWARAKDRDEDEVVMDQALDSLGTKSVAQHWIEASIPVPTQQTISGEVVS